MLTTELIYIELKPKISNEFFFINTCDNNEIVSFLPTDVPPAKVPHFKELNAFVRFKKQRSVNGVIARCFERSRDNFKLKIRLEKNDLFIFIPRYSKS